MVNEKQHALVPKHQVLNEEDSENLLKKLNTSKIKLPKIYSTDAALKNIKIKVGDVIEIERTSHDGNTIKYWRIVVEKKTTGSDSKIDTPSVVKKDSKDKTKDADSKTDRKN